MKNRLLILLLTLFPQWVIAQESTSANIIGVGNSRILDTYINQEKFSGFGLTYLYIKECAKPDKRWNSVIEHEIDFSSTKDRSKDNQMLEGNYYLYKNQKTYIRNGESVEYPLYYRPDFDAALAATVNYNDKVIGRAEFQTLGRMPYTTVKDAADADSTLFLPMRLGLNLEVEYRHNKALSFFLKFDNLLFQRYFYWQNYPSYRGLCLVGLTYTLH